MSAVAEKSKPVSPLGSFLQKIEAKPVAKVEPVVELKAEVNDVTPKAVEPLVQTEADPAKEAVKAKPSLEAKTEGQPGYWKQVRERERSEKDAKLQERADSLAKTNDFKAIAKAIAEAEKGAEEAKTWGNEERKARLESDKKAADLQSHLARIEAKLDGTYQEPDLPSTEQVVANAESRGRIIASHKAAVRQYGVNFVMETVWNADSPYQKLAKRDPRIEADVLAAEDPVLAAIDAVSADQDGEKYGRTPKEIRERMEAELAPKLKQEILEGLKTKPGPSVNTLGNMRGGSERTEQKNGSAAKLDFRQVFPWGASRL